HLNAVAVKLFRTDFHLVSSCELEVARRVESDALIRWSLGDGALPFPACANLERILDDRNRRLDYAGGAQSALGTSHLGGGNNIRLRLSFPAAYRPLYIDALLCLLAG